MPGAVDGNGVEHRVHGTGVRISAAAFRNGELGVLEKRLSFSRVIFGHDDPDGIAAWVTGFIGGNVEIIPGDIHGEIAESIAVNVLVISVPVDYFLFPFGGFVINSDVQGNGVQKHPAPGRVVGGYGELGLLARFHGLLRFFEGEVLHKVLVPAGGVLHSRPIAVAIMFQPHAGLEAVGQKLEGSAAGGRGLDIGVAHSGLGSGVGIGIVCSADGHRGRTRRRLGGGHGLICAHNQNAAVCGEIIHREIGAASGVVQAGNRQFCAGGDGEGGVPVLPEAAALGQDQIARTYRQAGDIAVYLGIQILALVLHTGFRRARANHAAHFGEFRAGDGDGSVYGVVVRVRTRHFLSLHSRRILLLRASGVDLAQGEDAAAGIRAAVYADDGIPVKGVFRAVLMAGVRTHAAHAETAGVDIAAAHDMLARALETGGSLDCDGVGRAGAGNRELLIIVWKQGTAEDIKGIARGCYAVQRQSVPVGNDRVAGAGGKIQLGVLNGHVSAQQDASRTEGNYVALPVNGDVFFNDPRNIPGIDQGVLGQRDRAAARRGGNGGGQIKIVFNIRRQPHRGEQGGGDAEGQ